jgi:hypothetical protein
VEEVMEWVALAAIFVFITQLGNIDFGSLISEFKALVIGPVSPGQIPPGSRDIDVDERRLPPPDIAPPLIAEPGRLPKEKEDESASR